MLLKSQPRLSHKLRGVYTAEAELGGVAAAGEKAIDGQAAAFGVSAQP
ncbi:MAG: hypothetical protein ACKOE3_12070 [Betaproteobacteria bacterium]